MVRRGLQLIEDIKKLSKNRNITTPTGTLIQDKEFYFTNLENYFKKGKIDKKWIDVLEEIKNDLENENI